MKVIWIEPRWGELVSDLIYNMRKLSRKEMCIVRARHNGTLVEARPHPKYTQDYIYQEWAQIRNLCQDLKVCYSV